MTKLFSKIKFTSAGAGSGKTTEITEILYQAIVSGSVDPGTVVAVTYTTAAAAELVQRVRQKLIEKGKVSLAHAMESARIGTVHSVCAELLKEYCYEHGTSPEQRVITDEEEKVLFAKAVAQDSESGSWRTIAEVALRFGLTLDNFKKDVSELGRLARANAIDPRGILDAIPGSIAQIPTVYGPRTKKDLSAALTQALGKFLKAHPEPLENTKVAIHGHSEVIQQLELIQETGALRWRAWHGLAKLNLGAKAKAYAEEISEVAKSYVTHPQFQDDVATLTKAMHEAAAEALDHYAAKKKALGLIDFTDMEQQFLQLLDRPEVMARLKEEVCLLYVDEFQDTNPMQLAIFMKLAEVCRETTWVGDPKQSIYAFRGADPKLTESLLSAVPKSNLKILSNNYRSRKELVDFTSALFTQAFSRDGIPEKQVTLQAKKKFNCSLSPLQVWRPTEKVLADQADCVAEQVKALLNSGKSVTDRTTGEVRPLRAGDVAILVRNNDRIPSFAASLAKRGISVTCKLTDISELPEVTLALAAYRFAIDPRDTVAAAELALLMGIDRSQWVNGAVTGAKAESWHPAVMALSELKDQVSELTPSEILDRALTVAQIEERLKEVSRGAERASNLALLRIQVRQYEEHCEQTGTFCAPVGLMGFLKSLEFEGKSESRADTAHIMTYHSAKGLEWPVVILFDLDNHLKWDSIISSRIVTTQKFIAEKPLENRVVRYLPYVLDKNSNLPELAMARLDASTEEQALRAATEAQERRLLYVGMTRPRESLILVVPEGRDEFTGTFIGALQQKDGSPLIEMPAEPGEPLTIAGKAYDCEVVLCGLPSALVVPTTESRLRFPVASGPEMAMSAPLLRLSPSTLEETDVDGSGSAAEVISLGKAFSTPNHVERDVLGEAIHTFLGADELTRGKEERLQFAQSVLARWGVEDALKPADLVEMADRLDGFLKQRMAHGHALRELPMALMRDRSQLHGFIDLMVVSDSEVAIIDHKSSYLHDESADRLIKRYASQLLAYEEAVRNSESFSNRKVSLWLHLPVAGKMVKVVV